MPQERTLHLEAERLNMEELWRSHQAAQVPLAVAAAITFHQVHGNTKAIVTRADYDDALNIAAAAISRLIPIYSLSDPRAGRVQLAVDLTKARFQRGATELYTPGGQAVRDMTVRRAEFASALSLIKRTGLAFSFAALPGEPAPDTQAKKEPSPR
jgi:hypothetical protein